jgi:hypothetical protein
MSNAFTFLRRMECVMWKNALRAFFHITHSIRRAPQAQASAGVGNQARSNTALTEGAAHAKMQV